mmetsp:Transcript_9661/g.29299  ORF Transcript_9661/g.29299 Transcript_9661/m.29299 type:complete len:290 (-) Transcript_9661:2457-3326(-)
MRRGDVEGSALRRALVARPESRRHRVRGPREAHRVRKERALRARRDDHGFRKAEPVLRAELLRGRADVHGHGDDVPARLRNRPPRDVHESLGRHSVLRAGVVLGHCSELPHVRPQAVEPRPSDGRGARGRGRRPRRRRHDAPARRRDGLHRARDDDRGAAVQARRRFVEEENRRVRRELDGHGQALALLEAQRVAVAQRADLAVADVVQLEHRDDLVDELARLGRVLRVEAQRRGEERRLVDRRLWAVHVELLDVAGDARERLLVFGVAVDGDLALDDAARLPPRDDVQ